MSKLVIVESPAKCKKIESYLGNNYKCVASFGHIRELGKGLECIDFEKNFKPSFQLLSTKRKYIQNLRKHINAAKEIILATDDDREGEAIAWHICKVFKLPISTTKRIIFHEITKTAILNAVKNPIRVNMDKVNAQIARQVLDKMVGFTLSPILWKHISRSTKASLSAGRCQTPALRIIYENQKDIDESPGRKIYDTSGYFTNHNLEFKLNHSFKEEETVADFLEESVNHEHKYSVCKPKKVKKYPPKPFSTSMLQQKASNEYHYSPKQTMKLAQTLYENGYITYMRTDSKTYSQGFIKNTEAFIEEKYGEDYVSDNNFSLLSDSKKKKKDNAQEAHEAIRPTKITQHILPNKIGHKEKRLYHLIWRNTLESCMATAEYTSITAKITSSKDGAIFKYTAEKVVFLGWKIVEGKDEDYNNKIYDYLLLIKKGQILNYNKIYGKLTLKDLKTHYTEARLVQMLERKGIGRPSTFSSLISKIQDRNYVRKENVKGKKISCVDFQLIGEELDEIETDRVFGNEKNKLILQPVGKMVIEFLLNHFDSLFVYEYTKQMEDELDVISKGNKLWYSLCDLCYKEMNKLSSKIATDHKESIRIDDNHVYMIAKYGPVVMYKKGESTKFKSARKDLDLDKLKRGEYSLAEIVDDAKKYTGKNLGQHKGKDVILKKGKFGLYLSWNGKNISAKVIRKTEETMTLLDVVDLLDGKKSANKNVLYQFENLPVSIRKGKFGPYVFYKTKEMKKPRFFGLGNEDNFNLQEFLAEHGAEIMVWVHEQL